MIRLNLRRETKLLLMVVGALTVVIILIMAFMEAPEEKSETIFGELEVKESKRPTATHNTSNYQLIKDRQKKVAKSNLRYKERRSEENPFFSLYKEHKAQPKQPSRVPKKAANEVIQEKKQEVGFVSASNSDSKQENSFFEAVFRERQQVQDGKALRIFLKEAIPSLQLEEGTILKGVPYLEEGSRLKIRVTAAIVDGKVKKVELICFDKEDCIEGLYHDELAAQLEADTKTGLLDEALDLDLSEEAMVNKVGRIARKFADITGRNKTIFIERGSELFVAVPEKPEDSY